MLEFHCSEKEGCSWCRTGDTRGKARSSPEDISDSLCVWKDLETSPRTPGCDAEQEGAVGSEHEARRAQPAPVRPLPGPVAAGHINTRAEALAWALIRCPDAQWGP